MDEKRKPVGIISVALTLLVLGGCGGGQKPQSRAEPITRLGEFYVGMPWEEALIYLPKDPELHHFERLFKDSPKRGEAMYYVLAKYVTEDEEKNGDKVNKIVLTLDHTKTIIRIHFSPVQEE
jgi:hypothetical protein